MYRTDFERLVVDEPLNLHAVVADRLQPTLEVHVRSLHGLNVAQRLGEGRGLQARKAVLNVLKTIYFAVWVFGFSERMNKMCCAFNVLPTFQYSD